jgi:membrane protease YdiL (CAAX protease family)
MSATILRDIDFALMAFGGLTIAVAAIRWWLNSSASSGRRDLLRHSPLRANSLGLIGPWVCIAGMLLSQAAGSKLAIWLTTGLKPELLQGWQRLFSNELAWVFTTLISLFVARSMFARGLYGFGIGRRSFRYELAVSVAGWLAAICITGLLVLASDWVLYRFFPAYEQPKHLVFQTLKDPSLPRWMRTFTLAGTLVLIPVGEEVLFRGILQTALQRLFPLRRGSFQHRWAAIIAVGALFGLFHVNTPQYIPALVALGILLGYLYERTGSLIVPILVHMLFNGKSLLFDHLLRNYLTTE